MLNQFNVSLWGDEAFSAVLSMNPVPKILEIISRDTSPPLYNLTLHFWYQAFGTSEIAIRALSFTYFLLAVFFIYKTGVLLFSRKTGFLAAVLTFLNPFFFTYAFEGRMYSILALGVVASTYFFLKILYSSKLENRNKNKNYTFLTIGYAFSTAWALYSHHFAIFALLVQGLWFVYEFIFGLLPRGASGPAGQRQAAINIFKGFVIAGILYAPWLLPLYKQTKMVGGGFWLGTPTLTDLRNLIYEYLAEGIKNPQIKIPAIDKDLGQISLYLVFAILILRNWLKGMKKSLLLISFFAGPVILTWTVSQKFQSIFFNRYLLYAIPFAMLIVASKGRKFTGIFVGILLILFGIIDYNYFVNPTKKPFRELSVYVKSTQKPDDVLINWNSQAHHLWESKYYQIPAPLYVPGNIELPFYVGTAQMTDSDILRKIPDVARVGVITSGNLEEITLPGYSEETTKTFGEIKFVWFEK